MPQVPVPEPMAGWCEALFDYGLISNNVTGLHYGLQCHVTVTKASSHDGIGFHVSVCNTAEALIGPGSCKPGTAVARVHFFPGMNSAITESWTFTNPGFIKAFPGYAHIKAQGIEFFHQVYPQYAPKAPTPDFTSEAEFPLL